jgi:hypothetical protein
MYELIGRRNAAFANVVSQDQLGIPLDCHKAPAISDSFHIFFVFPLVAFFFEDVSPNFIGLNVSHVEILNPFVH